MKKSSLLPSIGKEVVFIGMIIVSGSCLLLIFTTTFLIWETVVSLSISCR